MAVKTDGRMESSPRIAERDGPSRLPYKVPATTVYRVTGKRL